MPRPCPPPIRKLGNALKPSKPWPRPPRARCRTRSLGRLVWGFWTSRRCWIRRCRMRGGCCRKGRLEIFKDGAHCVASAFRWPLCSVRSRSPLAGVLTLTCTKRSMDMAIGGGSNGGRTRYCGRRISATLPAPHHRLLPYRLDLRYRPNAACHRPDVNDRFRAVHQTPFRESLVESEFVRNSGNRAIS